MDERVMKPEDHRLLEHAYSPNRVVVVGMGGGGNHTVVRMSTAMESGPELVAVNTDIQALGSCGGVRTVQIGSNVTQGLGAGGDPSLGRMAAEESKSMLRDLLFGCNLVMVVTSLGGGTGTGAAPYVAELARDEGATTICFATLPFSFEGRHKARQAEDGLAWLSSVCDLVVKIPNDHLLGDKREADDLLGAFTKMDEMLATACKAMWLLVSRPGVINLDMGDLRQIADRCGGICSFGYAEANGVHKAEKALNLLLHDSVYPIGEDLSSSDVVLVNILGGSDLTLRDIEQVMTGIRSRSDEEPELFFGATLEESMHGRMVLTVLSGSSQSSFHVGEAEFEKDSGCVAGDSEDKRSKSMPRQVRQADLNLDFNEKGRFKDVEPTLYEGADLDIPTFIRRGIKLSFEK